MRKSRLISVAAAAVASSIFSPAVRATSYVWNSLTAGTYNWTDAPNWNPNTAFPIGAAGAGDSANLNVAESGNLLINVAAGSYYLNKLTLGTTGGAFTTDVGNGNAGGGTLILDGGNPGSSDYADITSLGAAGATNIISAPIQLDQNGFFSGTVNGNSGTEGNFPFSANGSVSSVFLAPIQSNGFASVVFDGSSTNSINVSGNISQTATASAAVFNAMTGSNTLTLSGGITINNATVTAGQNFYVTGVSGSTTLITGVIADGTPGVAGNINYGYINPNKTTVYPAPNPTIILDSANTYTGITTLNMATLLVENDQAFGITPVTPPAIGNAASAEIRMGASANEYGFNIETSSDSITIPNGVKVNEFLTIEGQHSVTFTNYMYQSTSRELDNLLPAGKTLTLAGPIYIDQNTTVRTWTFDGPGLTLVTGSIFNSGTSGDDGTINCPLTKSGTGVVVVSGTAGTYRGATTVNGGLIEFAAPGAYGVQVGNAGTSNILVNTGGSIGQDTSVGGILGSMDQTFINLIAATGTVSTGSLALTALDAAQNIDFTGTVVGASNLSNANLAGLSIGAASNPVTYTGTITPATSGTYANTYRLGGGVATLTLTNANAITGASDSLVVTNGGSVALSNSNNYGGSTTIKGVYIKSNANLAAANNSSASGGAFETATLSIGELGNGLASSGSSLGSSSNAASNLIISGATLRYNGASAASTDRLFTISPVGATLDSSGLGAVDFTNPGALVEADAPSISSVDVGANSGSGVPFNKATGILDTSDLAVGMTVTDSDGVLTPFGAVTITGVDNVGIWLSFQPTTGFVADPTDTLTFTNQNRALNLTGSNTGLNTLTPALVDSPTGKLTLNKTGAGTWSIAGANTYSGGTNVTGGTLVIGAHGALPANSVVTIGSGASMQLGTNTGLATMSSLSIASGGTLDVNNDHMILSYGVTDPANTIYSELKSGYNGGAWTGTGIDSSAAALPANNANYGVGYVDGKDGVPGASVTSGQILIAYALYGDVNLDGLVNATDFAVFGANFNTAVTGWDKGDFTYTGLINATDFALLGANFGKSATGASISLPESDYAALDTFAEAHDLAIPGVPEPTTGALLLMAGAGTLLRRRRNARREA